MAYKLCPPRAVFNAVRYLGHMGAPWRYPPSDFPHRRWSISRRGAGSWQTALKRFAVDTPAYDDEHSHVEALARRSRW
jgi:transposase